MRKGPHLTWVYFPHAAGSAIPQSACHHRGVTLPIKSQCLQTRLPTCRLGSRDVCEVTATWTRWKQWSKRIYACPFVYALLLRHVPICAPPHTLCPWSQVLTITRLSRSPNTQFKEPNKPDGICEICPHVIIAPVCPHASHLMPQLSQSPPGTASGHGRRSAKETFILLAFWL